MLRLFPAVVVLAVLLAHPAEAQLRYASAQPMDALEARFENTEGWIGADGGHSCLLDDSTRLWLFSDTWLGNIRDGHRVDSTIVNNTLAIETVGSKKPPRFIIRKDDQGKPMAMFTPADGRGWFWLHDAVVHGGKLYCVLAQIERQGEGAFGFRQVGQTLGVVDNPTDDPLEWQLRQLPMPNAEFTDKRERTFGASLLVQDNYLYVYGTDEDVTDKFRPRYLTVARVPLESIEQFTSWQYYTDKGWGKDFRQATRMVPRMGTEFSVVYLPKLKLYAVVFTDNGLSDRIKVCTAESPTGPWSQALTVFRCPEVRWDKRNFCYGAKAHASLADDDQLVISYFTNSTELGHVAEDTRLYYPRFLSIKVSKLGK